MKARYRDIRGYPILWKRGRINITSSIYQFDATIALQIATQQKLVATPTHHGHTTLYKPASPLISSHIPFPLSIPLPHFLFFNSWFLSTPQPSTNTPPKFFSNSFTLLFFSTFLKLSFLTSAKPQQVDTPLRRASRAVPRRRRRSRRTGNEAQGVLRNIRRPPQHRPPLSSLHCTYIKSNLLVIKRLRSSVICSLCSARDMT